MPGSSSLSKHTKPPVPTIRRRKVGGAIQLKETSTGLDQAVICSLTSWVSPTKAELAIWRAFLAEEIDAILRDGE